MKTDNNPLTYVMTTPNLDACGQRWVEKLSRFNFSLTYLKGSANGAADALSRMPLPLKGKDADPPPEHCRCCVMRRCGVVEPEREHWNSKEVAMFLDAARQGDFSCATRAECDQISLVQEDENILDQVTRRAENCRVMRHAELHTLDWERHQRDDPLLKAIIDYLDELYKFRSLQVANRQKEKRAERQQAVKGKANASKLRKVPPQRRTGRPKKGGKGPQPPSLHQKLGLLANTPDGRAVYRYRNNFCLIGRKLYFKSPEPQGLDPLKVFVVPTAHRVAALNGCHDDAGHQGQERTLSLLTERFWWPGMREQCINLVSNCPRCAQHKGKIIKAPLQPIYATAPLDLVHLDFVTCETAPDGRTPIGNILCIMDHFTRYVLALAAPNQSAVTAAKLFYERFISVFGAPRRIVSDQGGSFTGAVFTELCNSWGISRTTTSAYHPMTNGQVERWNRTMLDMLGKLSEDDKYNWRDHLSEMAQAYNCTRCAVTGYSPHFLMFGRRPRLPVDVQFPTIRNSDVTIKVPEYVAALQDRFRLAYDAARKQANQEAVRQKRYYDKRTCTTQLKPGDTVLLKVDKVIGRRKLQDRWSDEHYTVERALSPDSPLYRIIDDRDNVKIVHRNKMLCIATANNPPTNISAKPVVFASGIVSDGDIPASDWDSLPQAEAAGLHLDESASNPRGLPARLISALTQTGPADLLAMAVRPTLEVFTGGTIT